MRVPISSFQNKRIKHVVKLRNRRHRDAGQETIVEGIREIQRALAQNIVPTAAFICPEIMDDGEETAVLTAKLEKLANKNGTQLFEITAEIFAKIAYRGDSGGLLL
ncbi:MAG: hypothetical protein KC421_09815, partial [Anaerolineales bacterium]|nr:hypothetical protein [Anaerolineales bacterium]